jgi:hypothetical protein
VELPPRRKFPLHLMPTALEGLKIGEISGVDHPAHLEEGWMVLKATGAAEAQVAKVEAVEELVEALTKASNLMEPDFLAQVGAEVLDASARETLAHLISKATKEAPSMPEPIDVDALDPEVAAYIKSLETERDEAVAAAAPAEEVTEETDLQKALDGLPEALREHFTKQAADLAEATKVAKAERDLRVDAEFIQKAREDYGDLPIKPEDFGPVLRKVAEFDATVFVEVDRVLKAAAAIASETALLKSIGSPAAQMRDGSAVSNLDSIAKAAVEADSTGNLTYAMALAKAAEEHPDLYEAHVREQRAAQKEG